MSERLPLSSTAPLELVRQYRFQWEPAQQCLIGRTHERSNQSRHAGQA